MEFDGLMVPLTNTITLNQTDVLNRWKHESEACSCCAVPTYFLVMDYSCGTVESPEFNNSGLPHIPHSVVDKFIPRSSGGKKPSFVYWMANTRHCVGKTRILPILMASHRRRMCGSSK